MGCACWCMWMHEEQCARARATTQHAHKGWVVRLVSRLCAQRAGAVCSCGRAVAVHCCSGTRLLRVWQHSSLAMAAVSLFTEQATPSIGKVVQQSTHFLPAGLVQLHWACMCVLKVGLQPGVAGCYLQCESLSSW